MKNLAIIVFFFVEYLPEDGRKRPKRVEELLNVCTMLYPIIVQLFWNILWPVFLHEMCIILNLLEHILTVDR